MPAADAVSIVDRHERGYTLCQQFAKFPGWTVLYEIAEAADFSLQVSSVQVTPTDPAAVPEGGVGGRMLRQLPTQGAITTLREIVRREQRRTPVTTRRWLLERGFVELARQGADPVGRGGRSDATLAELAARYTELCASGSRTPTVDLAAEMKAQGIERSAATVEAMVRQARKRDLLTAAPKGRPGGQLTEKAERLLADLDADKSYLRRRKQWVHMRHPDIPHTKQEPPRVTRLAFDEVWADKGWQLVKKSSTKGRKR